MATDEQIEEAKRLQQEYANTKLNYGADPTTEAARRALQEYCQQYGIDQQSLRNGTLKAGDSFDDKRRELD
ncbi:MAG TPA: hypothetical protein PKL83_03135 [bacterium]|nr:hypothetical protein [bacterium]